MMRKVFVPATAVWLLTACLTAAQQQTGANGAGQEGQTGAKLGTNTVLLGGLKVLRAEDVLEPADLRMYEDIEIMRRLLAEKLSSLGRTSGSDGSARTDMHKGLGVAFADFDQDGRVDLYVANESGHPSLYINKGNGTFEEYQLATATSKFHAHDHSMMMAEPIEGIYLKGQGIIYSMSLPVLGKLSVKAQSKPVQKPLSPWERVSKELRGEKTPTGDQPPERKEETLIDGLLKLLAENGHNFSQLAEHESLTVALTLRTQRTGENCQSCHADPWREDLRSGGGKMGRDLGSAPGMLGGGGPGTGVGAAGKMGASGSGAANTIEGAVKSAAQKQTRTTVGQALNDLAARVQEEAKSEGDPRKGLWKQTHLDAERKETASLVSEAQNHALLGDLHLKQGRYRDAEDAYRKAVDTQHKVFSLLAKLQRPADQVTGYLTYIEYVNKLAQCQSASGSTDGALRSLKELADYSRLVEDYANKAQRTTVALTGLAQVSVSSPAPAIALPSKFIVSAPKKLLDQVGAGKISFEEFKKGATVQYLAFSSPKNDQGAAGVENKGKTNPGGGHTP